MSKLIDQITEPLTTLIEFWGMGTTESTRFDALKLAAAEVRARLEALLGEGKISSTDKMAGEWIESYCPDMGKDENFNPVDALNIWAGGYGAANAQRAADIAELEEWFEGGEYDPEDLLGRHWGWTQYLPPEGRDALRAILDRMKGAEGVTDTTQTVTTSAKEGDAVTFAELPESDFEPKFSRPWVDSDRLARLETKVDGMLQAIIDSLEGDKNGR